VSKRDYYEILSVERTATDAELKSAYRKLALKHHPDRNPGNHAAEEKFKECAEAYAVLADPEKRAAYDRFGHAGVSAAAGAGGFDPSVFSGLEDIFGNLGDVFGFGDLFGGGRRRGGPQRGADLRYDLEISFEESAHGTETPIQIPRQESCDACAGSGAAPGSSPAVCNQCHSCRGAGRMTRERKLTVKIPAGIATGQQLRMTGEGEAGTGGGPHGSLYVVIHVQEHEFFRRDGLNLFCEIPVNYTTLALGGEIQVPTLDGIDEIKVPEGTQTGTTLRLRGKGMPDVNGRGKGDLFATVQVQTPKKLTKDQRQALEQLARTLPKEHFEPRKRHDEQDERNLFDRVKDMFG
jgi:molecular chaperone DnaJ